MVKRCWRVIGVDEFYFLFTGRRRYIIHWWSTPWGENDYIFLDTLDGRVVWQKKKNTGGVGICKNLVLQLLQKKGQQEKNEVKHTNILKCNNKQLDKGPSVYEWYAGRRAVDTRVSDSECI